MNATFSRDSFLTDPTVFTSALPRAASITLRSDIRPLRNRKEDVLKPPVHARELPEFVCVPKRYQLALVDYCLPCPLSPPRC